MLSCIREIQAFTSCIHYKTNTSHHLRVESVECIHYTPRSIIDCNIKLKIIFSQLNPIKMHTSTIPTPSTSLVTQPSSTTTTPAPNTSTTHHSHHHIRTPSSSAYLHQQYHQSTTNSSSTTSPVSTTTVLLRNPVSTSTDIVGGSSGGGYYGNLNSNQVSGNSSSNQVSHGHTKAQAPQPPQQPPPQQQQQSTGYHHNVPNQQQTQQPPPGHSFLSAVSEVKNMENALLGLLASFNSGELSAFGKVLLYSVYFVDLTLGLTFAYPLSHRKWPHPRNHGSNPRQAREISKVTL